MDNTITNRAADNIRILSAAMVEKAKSGHPGGAMGGADFINILYSEFLNYDPERLDYPFRDRFFLDPGHMSPMLYSVLALTGAMPAEELKNFRQWGSHTPGHPEADLAHAIENTSGPLGQGHAMAVGAAIAERFLVARFGEWMAHKTYVYISDGGIQEEVAQGVGRMAGLLGLSNYIMYYDANNVQLSTTVEEVMNEDIAGKYRAWGWNVINIDGHDADQIREALKAANEERERPTLIIGKTVMAKGACGANGENFENKVCTHGQPLSAAGADIHATIAKLGGNPDEPFAIFPESRQLYEARAKELRNWADGMKEVEAKWRRENPELAGRLDSFLSGKLPEIDFDAIDPGKDAATRAASAKVLGVFAEKIGNMIVASADLSNSDKTDGFLKKTKAFAKGDFSGQFLQMGVSEFTMACIMNGDSGLRHVLRLLRLHETRHSPVGPHEAACHLHLDARLVPRRRGRSHAPAHRTGGTDQAHGACTQPPGRTVDGGTASGRRTGNGCRLEVRHRRRASRSPHPLAPEHQGSARRPQNRGEKAE